MAKRTDCHSHTRYSNLRLRDALATPKQLIDRALELGLSAIAITDHEVLSAHVKANKYAQEIKENNPDFKVILGNEIYLVNERPSQEHYHFILLAKNAKGHKQLRKLSSIAWLNAYNVKGMTRVDTLKSDLEKIINEDPGNIIATTACIGGELGKSILSMEIARSVFDAVTAKKEHDNIVNFLLWCKDLFEEDFYLEVQPGVSDDQIIVNKKIKVLSSLFNIKVIATCDTHYLKKEDRYVHKAFLNSENKEREVDAFYQDTYLHSNEEMIEKFKLSEYSEEYVNELFNDSMEIYNKIEDYSLLHTPVIPEVKVDYYPKQRSTDNLLKYPTLSSMYQSDNVVNRYWINTCIKKLKEIGKFNETYLNELEEEAEVKTIVGDRLNTNMFQYPITFAHYINLIWGCGSTIGVGRGSACSALNHYLLGITQLDPLEWDFPFFRYMNRDTDSLGDIDIDVCSSKVQLILQKIREERSQDFIDNLSDIERKSLGAVYVCTFGTESSKSAILTACRGYRTEDYPDGIDVDTAQYLSSLIPVERGFVWSISDVYYGNPDKNRKPVKTFINEIDEYPGLLDIVLGIEGNISRRGRHASGVILMGEDPYEFNAFMKTPSGEVVTQYDLHDAEEAGSQKIDLLVTEVQDKIAQTIKFLQRDGIVDSKLSLREAYNAILHPDILPLTDKETWEVIQNAASLDLFQLDSDIGRQGAKKVKPNSMIELSSVNGLIRLMTQDKGAESWIDRYVRYKNNPVSYEKDISRYGLSKIERASLDKYLKDTYGIGISQEQLMRVLMDKDICEYSLKEANKARKIVSKKQMSKIPEFKKKVFETAKSDGLAHYVWDFVVSVGLGYSFSDIHSLSYSFIGFQTAYLATHWNPIYWNTACLIVNSGSLEEDNEYEIEIEEDNDGEPIKKKEKGTDYAKVAKALGDIISKGINVSLVDINRSNYSFEPDIENNQILFGMKALSGVNSQMIEQIISGRPYTSFNDFLNRCPLNKTAMISLIKAGSFDKLETEWAKELNIEPRILIMVYYLYKACEPKSKLTLQNFNGLIQRNLIPPSLDFQKKVFEFNKFIRTKKYYDILTDSNYYVLIDALKDFYFDNFDIDKLNIIEGLTCILQSDWEKIYKKEMDAARDWLKENQEQILKEFNSMLFLEFWNKYASGTISAWEMESLCFYYHDHELIDIDTYKYGISDFFKMPEEPVVDYFFKRNNKQIPIYRTYKIIGTVISKNDTRSSVAVLTTTGVVNVKFTKEYYALYNRQISELQTDGTKKIMERGWFSRGMKIMVTGFRREDTFVAKRYKSTPTHQLYKITEVKNGDMKLIHERYGEKGEN